MDSKPETAAEALTRWDAGEIVWTAEMGGLGPGYEQVIHIIAFEAIRVLLTLEIAWEVEPEEWKTFYRNVQDEVTPKIQNLGCSGAQFGAAMNLAFRVVKIGWAKALDELPKDRLIQVSKNWPQMKETT